MVSVPVMKPKQIVALLLKAGFEFKRSKGSHHLYRKGSKLVVVPMHNRELKRGTLHSIMK